MPNIDFPASPTTGSVYFADQNMWIYDGEKWSIFSWGTPFQGNSDGMLIGGTGRIPNFITADGGLSGSTFGSDSAVNGGTA